LLKVPEETIKRNTGGVLSAKGGTRFDERPLYIVKDNSAQMIRLHEPVNQTPEETEAQEQADYAALEAMLNKEQEKTSKEQEKTSSNQGNSVVNNNYPSRSSSPIVIKSDNTSGYDLFRYANWLREQNKPGLVYKPLLNLGQMSYAKDGGKVSKAQNGTSGIPQNASALDAYLMSNMQMPTSDNLFTGQQVANLINSIHLNQPLVQAQEDGGKVEKAEDGMQSLPNKSPRPGNINVPTLAGLLAEVKQRKAADSGNATNRNFSKVNWRGNQYFLERANIDGNTVDTWIQVTPNLDTLVQQQLPSGRYTPLTQEQAQSIVNRNRSDINKEENGGVVKDQNKPT